MLIARNHEREVLQKFLDSNHSEFMAVYGRRRVGKTFLIKNYFQHKKSIFFHVTGVEKGSFATQRQNFTRRLSEVFLNKLPIQIPKDWQSAFELLKNSLDTLPKNKQIVLFFDEFPWMATPRSRLLESLEYFWNEYWSNDRRIKLIICGSSASWIIKNIINNTGGLFQRVTYRLRIEPFTLLQTKLFLESKQIKLTHQQIALLYMVIGGIPLYLEQVKKGFTADQIIDQLCFNKNGLLFDEIKELFGSLFRNEAVYIKIVREIAKHYQGISKDELSKHLKLPRGGRLSTRLEELEDAGFIMSFIPYQRKERGEFYKIIDEYTMFYFYWISSNLQTIRHFDKASGLWLDKIKSGAYYTWKGLAFESICYKHIQKIISKLNLRQSSQPYGWREKGAQIDLLFDRPDDAVTLCEIKYSEKQFIIDNAYAAVLENKKIIFKDKANIKKQIFIALISANGMKENKYSKQLVDQLITLDDLF